MRMFINFNFMEIKTQVLVLSSGGIDSTATIRFYQNLGCNVESIFIDFGQKARKNEGIASKKIARYYNVKYEKINTIFNEKSFSGGLIIGRNLFLLSLALMSFKYTSGVIAIGIHAGTTYYDCSKAFIKKANTIIKEYTDNNILIGSPFLTFNKREIYNFCRLNNVPLELTYSCELGLEQPCGQCITCSDLKRLYETK